MSGDLPRNTSVSDIESLPVHTGLVWDDDGHIDIQYMSHLLGKKVLSAKVTDSDDISGHTPMKSIQVCFETEKKLHLVLKKLPETQYSLSKKLGLYREAFFYSKLAPRLKSIAVKETGLRKSVMSEANFTPNIYLAQGCAETGEKAILMDDLKHYGGVQSGYFFGNCHPMNWKIDLLQEKGDCFKDITSIDVTKAAFETIAFVHGAFWLDSNSLLKDTEIRSFLRGSDWYNEQGKESWLRAQNMAIDSWKITMEKIEKGSSNVNFEKTFIDIINNSLSKVSWDDFVKSSKSNPWTLVHGDFYPANMFVMNKLESKKSKQLNLNLIDWEMVGVGSGPQELGQYLVSHMNPKQRKECEEELVFSYYETLTNKMGVKKADYSWEDCWTEYRNGSVSRWLWFCAYLSTQVSDDWMQYFHDQTLAFINDHNFSCETVQQPRV